MAKFHVKLKIQGFELEVDGTREDMPVMREALGQQLAGLLTPATEIAEGEVSTPASGNGSTPAAVAEASRRGRRRVRSAPVAAGESNSRESAVVWRHDTTKYGSPQQTWSNADKAIWLLYVAGEEANIPEMSNARIAKTFAKQFRSAGLIRSNNLSRDLSRFKVAQDGKPPLVSEDATKATPAWFLTEAGKKHAQQLIAQALGQPVAAL